MGVNQVLGEPRSYWAWDAAAGRRTHVRLRLGDANPVQNGGCGAQTKCEMPHWRSRALCEALLWDENHVGNATARHERRVWHDREDQTTCGKWLHGVNRMRDTAVDREPLARRLLH